MCHAMAARVLLYSIATHKFALPTGHFIQVYLHACAVHIIRGGCGGVSGTAQCSVLNVCCCVSHIWDLKSPSTPC
jgi:hypothetical protein